MAVQYNKIALRDISKGIDARSSQNTIDQGFAEDLLNCDTNSEGYLHKREGYIGHFGNLPIRVQKVIGKSAEQKLLICFDNSISMSAVPSVPVVVHGRLSGGGSGDWSTADSAHYYSGFAVAARQPIILDGTDRTVELEHDEFTPDLLTQIVNSDQVDTLDSSLFYPDSVKVSTTFPYNIEYGYNADLGVTRSSLVFTKSAATVIGDSYSNTYSGFGTTITIPAVEHNLLNVNVVPDIYEIQGGEYVKVFPDSFVIKADSSIEITFAVAPTNDIRVVLRDVPFNQTGEAAVTAGVTTTITVPVSPDDSAFFYAAYIRNGADRELVIPDQINYISADNEIQYVFESAVTRTIQVMYDIGTIIANCIEVEDDSIVADFEDEKPQMTVWGIEHEGIYVNSDSFGGHTTHIDKYKRRAEGRLVAGIGGVLHTNRTRAETGGTKLTDGSYLIPSSFVKLQHRTVATSVVGPLFHADVDDTDVTRAIKGSNIVANFVEVSGATFDTVTGYVDIQINIADQTGETLAGALRLDEDQLTISNMAFSRLNGTHLIKDVIETDTIRVEIPSITTSDFDEVDSCGRGGIFTDRIEFTDTTVAFTEGDALLSDVFTGNAVPNVTSVDGSIVTANGYTDEVALPGGILIRGSRTGNILPVASSVNYVIGDMCEVKGMSHQVRIVGVVNTPELQSVEIDETITFEDDGSNSFNVTVVGRWIPIEAPTPRSSDLVPTTQFAPFNTFAYDQQQTIRSTMSGDNMYFTNNEDEIMKFDGQNIYRAGLIRWQPQLFATVDNTFPSISKPGHIAKVATEGSIGDDTVEVDGISSFAPGQQITIDGSNEPYTVTGVIAETASTPRQIRITPDLADVVSVDALIRPLRKLQYYFRLDMVDANQNAVASATTGLNDYIINLTDDGQVRLRLVGMPIWDSYDFDRIRIQGFRQDTDGTTGFGKVLDVSIPLNKFDGYIDITDAINNPNIIDTTNLILSQGELGNRWTQPLRAKQITTVDNKLTLSNVSDYPELNIELRKTTGNNVQAGAVNTRKLTIRRLNTDTDTDTNMVDRATYQWLTSGGVALDALNPFQDGGGAVTVNMSANRTLSAGNWVYLYHSTKKDNAILEGAGWYQVIEDTINSSSFKINEANTPQGLAARLPDTVLFAGDKNDIPVFLGDDFNYNTATGNIFISAERLAMIRMANAINATMRVTNVDIPGQEDFRPWIVAGAGDEFGPGVMSLRAPRSDVFPSAQFNSSIQDTQFIFNNQTIENANDIVPAPIRVFPSRVITSFKNNAEIFDGSFGLADDSSNVFSINADDGEQIVGHIPFFGVAAFSGSQVEDMLVVFKENSIQVLSTNTNIIRKLETQGVGCSAPNSIALTKDGVMFAHQSGIYRLNRDLTISYAGKYLERIWRNEVSKNDISRATATQFSINRQYKLSVPKGVGQINNNEVLVYDHTRESDPDIEFGAWTRYDNHNATGWTNLFNDGFFGTTNGKVYKIRNVGDASDYRDDADPIQQIIVGPPLDFGLPGVIKLISNVVLQFQVGTGNLTNTVVSASNDIDGIFRDLDQFELIQDANDSGIDAFSLSKVQSVSFGLVRKRAEYLQLRLINGTIDEDMRLAGYVLTVGLSSNSTILDAASTKK